MNDFTLYLTSEQTGLPFTVEKNHMNNFRALFGTSMIAQLTISDIINIHLLTEIRNKKSRKN